MDKIIYVKHAEMCKVFTSPVRVEIMDILRNGKKSVNELVQITGVSQSNVSQHLQVMKEKGIVTAEKQGNRVFYSLSNPKISEAFGILKEILTDQLAESGALYRSISPAEAE